MQMEQMSFYRCPPARVLLIIVVLLYVLLALVLLSPLGAEQTAILLIGPKELKGIDYLSPNVLPAFQGLYQLDEAEIQVVFTREPVLIPASWPTERCGDRQLYQIPGEDLTTFCYQDEQEQSHFFVFPEGFSDPCAFVDVYSRRFQSLQSFVANPLDVPFPAILELP